jgi:hypothetical protein
MDVAFDGEGGDFCQVGGIVIDLVRGFSWVKSALYSTFFGLRNPPNPFGVS